MADYNSSLPIRTENAGDVIVKVSDATVPGQQLKVEADGSINVNSVVSATDFDIRDLVFATDKVDVSGSEVSLDATTLAALENISAVVSATDLDIRDLVFATDKVDVSGSEVSLDSATLAALENINAVVSATDLDIRDLTHASDSVKIGDGTDFLAVNTDGSINVNVIDDSPGTAINDYDTQASLAAAASDTHTYTSVGNFYLTQINASASGKMKIVVAVNGANKFVMFNSTANPNLSLKIEEPILATTGQTVTIVRTNLDNQAQDVYSTITGYSV